MEKLFSMDNPIWRILGMMWDAIWLTILWAVFSLPIVTIGASTTALYSVAIKIIANEEGVVTKQFVAAFRENFKQATIAWLILLAAGIILGVNIWFYGKMGNAFGKMFLIVLLIFGYVYLMILHYIFPVLARFDDSLKNLAAMSFVLSVKNFGWTLLMITVTICVVVVGVFGFAPLLAGSAGIIALLHAWILKPVFGQYIKALHLG